MVCTEYVSHSRPSDFSNIVVNEVGLESHNGKVDTESFPEEGTKTRGFSSDHIEREPTTDPTTSSRTLHKITISSRNHNPSVTQ